MLCTPVYLSGFPSIPGCPGLYDAKIANTPPSELQIYRLTDLPISKIHWHADNTDFTDKIF